MAVAFCSLAATFTTLTLSVILDASRAVAFHTLHGHSLLILLDNEECAILLLKGLLVDLEFSRRQRIHLRVRSSSERLVVLIGAHEV